MRNAQCEAEIANPFVLRVMLQRYREHGHLSPIRSDNVGYVIDRLNWRLCREKALPSNRAQRAGAGIMTHIATGSQPSSRY